MVFLWGLNDSKFSLVSETLLNILADFSSASGLHGFISSFYLQFFESLLKVLPENYKLLLFFTR